jgi:RNA polymerase sigma factor (sigma-70 family)
VLEHLRRVVLANGTDGQLLEEYLRRRDEAALSALVRRHARMVWCVCRRTLSNHHDAEDAFQATFLVLVRKASSIRPREMVGNWLYGVAHQTARKARATVAKRQAREKQVSRIPEPTASPPSEFGPDQEALLDQELSRLPDKFRAVLVLCDLQGKPRKEVARQLNIPEGTLSSRLTTARAKLAKRLTRHGLAVSAGVVATTLSRQAASAGVPPSVVCSTIKAVSLWAAGQAGTSVISVQAAALAEGVLKAMLFNNLRAASAVLVIVALVGIGSGATALLAGDESGQIGYQLPAATKNTKAVTARPVEVALDANGGRGKPYFYFPPDPSNINHLWKLTPVGDYHLIESKLGELALDASGGRGNPYLRHSDPTNINHLWKLVKVDACYLIVPKVGDGELALDANGGRNSPYFRKFDATNQNLLWELRKAGDYHMLVPLVRREAAAAKSKPPQGLEVLRQLPVAGKLFVDPTASAVVAVETKEAARRAIEQIIQRAEAAGGDRQTLLEEIEKAVKEMWKEKK